MKSKNFKEQHFILRKLKRENTWGACIINIEVAANRHHYSEAQQNQQISKNDFILRKLKQECARGHVHDYYRSHS